MQWKTQLKWCDRWNCFQQAFRTIRTDVVDVEYKVESSIVMMRSTKLLSKDISFNCWIDMTSIVHCKTCERKNVLRDQTQTWKKKNAWWAYIVEEQSMSMFHSIKSRKALIWCWLTTNSRVCVNKRTRSIKYWELNSYNVEWIKNWLQI